MNQTERFYKIDQILRAGPASSKTLREALEVSPSTFKRDIEYMRGRLYAPIKWDKTFAVYNLDLTDPDAKRYALPGLWFSASEIHALLTMQYLLAQLEPGGILQPHIQPLVHRLNTLLGSAHDSIQAIRRRILIVGIATRSLKLQHFEQIGSALLQRQRIQITYRSRSSDATTQRVLSPQRLVHYRGNWYLDAWCHLREELRSFAIDAMQDVATLEHIAKEITTAQLEHTFGPAYGIFAGEHIQIAKLRFTPQRARWVAHENWHPQQKGQFDADGYYLLEIPYADHRELCMDILKYGPDCEVLAPRVLRDNIKSQVDAMRKIYFGEGGGVSSGGPAEMENVVSTQGEI